MQRPWGSSARPSGGWKEDGTLGRERLHGGQCQTKELGLGLGTEEPSELGGHGQAASEKTILAAAGVCRGRGLRMRLDLVLEAQGKNRVTQHGLLR